MYLDGAEWSDAEASIGELRLGPAGMLGLLEGRLGLSAPETPPAIRINQYMARMEECNADSVWFHKSFERDPWSTAQQLLSWRDELAEAGWQGAASEKSPNRLKSLALLEKSKLPLAAGTGDRLCSVLETLNHASDIGIRLILLVEELESLPPVWQKIVNALEANGAEVEIVPKSPGDILDKDEALVMMEANNEWEAAENLATWLAADAEANGDVGIICGTGTRLLDQAIAKRGLPALGRGESSRWRPYLQLLPLTLANLWKPIDIHRLVDLLSLPVGIVTRKEAFLLLKAISQEPGVGGEQWQEALKKIEEEYVKRELEKDPSAKPKKLREEAVKHAADINGLLADNRYPETEGVPAIQVIDRCYQAGARLRKHIAGNPEIAIAMGHINTMLKLMDGKSVIKKTLLERMIDSVVESAPDDNEQTQLSAWHVYARPEHLAGSVKTLVWWGFVEPDNRGLTYWTNAERGELAAQGSPLEEHKAIRDREAAAQRRAVNLAEKAILIYPKQMRGEDVGCHPLWDELTAGNDEKPIASATSIVSNDNWEFAGRKTKFLKKDREIFEQPQERYQISKGLFKKPAKISPSQMKTMISCPLLWAVQYQAGIQPAAALVAPADHQMKGILCHKIASIVLSQPGMQENPRAAKKEAAKVYDEITPQIASELHLRGRAIENARLKEAMGEAIAVLAQYLNNSGLKVSLMEQEHLKDLPDKTIVRGRVDLVATDSQGKPFVVDLKWTSGLKKKEAEIEEGRALQLAAYAWILKPEDSAEEIGAGYFMLAQGEFIGNDDFSAVWEKGIASWKKRASEINEGKLEAAGIIWEKTKEAGDLTSYMTIKSVIEQCGEKGLLYQESDCRYCNYRVLCGATEAAE